MRENKYSCNSTKNFNSYCNQKYAFLISYVTSHAFLLLLWQDSQIRVTAQTVYINGLFPDGKVLPCPRLVLSLHTAACEDAVTARTDLRACSSRACSVLQSRSGIAAEEKGVWRQLRHRLCLEHWNRRCQCWVITVLRNQVFQSSFGTSFCPRLSKFLL